MLMNLWVFYEVRRRCIEDDEEEERKDEDEVFYKYLGLAPLRNLFFDFGPSNFMTQNIKLHISVVYHVTRCHVIPRLPHRRFCNK